MDSFWVVLNPDGTYAGVPCESFEECRELVAAREGRIAYEVDPNFYTSFDGGTNYYVL